MLFVVVVHDIRLGRTVTALSRCLIFRLLLLSEYWLRISLVVVDLFLGSWLHLLLLHLCCLILLLPLDQVRRVYLLLVLVYHHVLVLTAKRLYLAL